MRLRGYYRAGDFEAMHRLDLKCFSPAFQFDAEMMRQAAESRSAIVAVVEAGTEGEPEHEPEHEPKDGPAKEMLGFVILHMEGAGARRYGYIVTLDVAPEARRVGIATLMLDHAEEQARVAGARRIALHVAVDNTGAVAFYERRGYLRAGVARGYYREIGLDAFVYTKQLEKPSGR